MKLLSAAYLLPGLLVMSSAPPLEAQFAEAAKLLASDGAAGDTLGNAVAVYGDRALVGAPHHVIFGPPQPGSAYVFERKPDGTWTQSAKLQPSDSPTATGFGSSASMSGNRALLGLPFLFNGSAYLFERDAGGAWTEVAKLTASDGEFQEAFGYAVSISRNRALVGAGGDDDLGDGSGSAYVFERGAGGTWSQVAKLKATDGAAFDEFGVAVSIAGDLALVGALNDDDLGNASGSAYLFELGAAGAWTQVAKLKASDGTAGDQFGVSVSIHGERALIGAYFADALGDSSGAAYMFERGAGGTWTQVAKLMPSEGSATDQFGKSVALDGDQALVGAYGDDEAAYLFERAGGGLWVEVAKLVASDAAPSDNFGGSVSLSKGRALIGAFDDDDLGTGSGSAYVFDSSGCGPPLPSSEVVRPGSPPNPSALLPGLTGGPAFGSLWDPAIDHTTFLPGALVDSLGIALSPLNLPMPPLGTLLCDPATTIMLETVAAGMPFAVLIPNDCAVVGVALCTQGASVDALGTILLTNALDITIGTF